ERSLIAGYARDDGRDDLVRDRRKAHAELVDQLRRECCKTCSHIVLHEQLGPGYSRLIHRTLDDATFRMEYMAITSDVPSGFGALLRARGRRLAEMALTPHDPDDFLDLVAPLRSGAPLRARVVEVQAETRDAATIVRSR